MAIKFSLYYSTPEAGEYLQKVVTASRQGALVEVGPLDRLPAHVNSGTNAILLEYQTDNRELDGWIRRTTADHRNPPIFLYLPEITTDQLWKALRLGVKECFTYPIRAEEFQEALDRLPVLSEVPDLAAPTRLVSFLGSKGGVGTTFVAANAAYLLARQDRNQALLVDLDLRYGQLVHFFDAKPQYSIVEVIENADHLDRAYLQSLFYQYDKNLQLLPAPERLEDAEAVTPDQLEKVLNYLKKIKIFTHILVDLGHHLDEGALRSLELSDLIIVVANQTIPALSNAKKLLELLKLLGLEAVPLEVWLNSWQKSGELAVTDVAGFLGREVKGTIAFDFKETMRSINEGQPLARLAPGHAICRDLKVLAEHLEGKEGPPDKGSRWGLMNLFRR
jgi:pilus assembly protein CpaE